MGTFNWVLAGISLMATFATASWSAPHSYNADLAEASRFTAALKKSDALRETSGLTASTGPVQQLELGRFYKVGDAWIVSVRRLSRGDVGKSIDRQNAKNEFLNPVLYEFRVTSVSAKAAQIKVSQVTTDRKPIDTGRVSHIVISLDRDFRLTSKQYFYRDLTSSVTALHNSASNVPTGFDAFPVDLPDFQRSKISQNASSDGLTFESPDLLFRPVRITWRKGDLWPANIESPSGQIVLIKQDKV